MIGRYIRVRPLWAHRGWGPVPYILDRQRATLTPYEGTDEWAWQRHVQQLNAAARARQRRDEVEMLKRMYAVRSERSIPAYAMAALTTGMAGFGHWPKILPGISGPNSLVATTLALDSTYANNTTCDSVAGRLALAATHGNLDAIYYYVTAVTGTPSTIYAEVTTTNATITLYRATTTIRTSGTGDPTADGTMVAWHKIVPTTYSPAAETQWIILGNQTATPTSHFITALAGLIDTSTAHPGSRFEYTAATATAINSVSANMAAIAGPSALVVVFADGAVFGLGLGSLVTPASDTNRKGWRHPGFTESLRAFGLAGGLLNANITGAQISADAAAPGTTVAAGTQLLATTSIFGSLFSAPYDVPRATPLRYVFTFGAGTSGPQAYSTGVINGFTDINEARPFGSGSYYAIANGTTNWANDDVTSVPHMALLVEDQVAVSGGSGGGLRLAGHGGLAA